MLRAAALALTLLCSAAPLTAGSVAGLDHALAAADAGRPVWVFLEARDLDGEALSRARAEVRRSTPARTLERRLRRGGPAALDVRESDLPLGTDCIEAIAGTGARVRRESRWLNAVSVEATSAQLEAIAALPFVRGLRPVARWTRAVPEVVTEGEGVSEAEVQRGGFYGAAGSQVGQLNIDVLHQMGFTGTGVVMAVLDTGFNRTHDGFSGNGGPHVIAEYDFINDDGNTAFESGDAALQHCHGTYVLGVLAAYNPGVLVGAAYDASYILCKTEDTLGEYQGEEDNYVAALEFAELNGADLATSSLGYIDWYTQADLDGVTAVTTMAVNEATSRGMVCLTAAGNEGNDGDPATSSLIAPADAFSVITVGAVNRTGSTLGFSSDGPTADGRLKPEVLARGVNVQTVTCLSTTAYTGVDGTSFATPLVAGAVACLLQARPAWTVAQVREHLFATASDYAATGQTDPLFIRGYGVVDAYAALLDSACAGDVDGSASVDFSDLELVLERWGTADPLADLNASGVVDFDDLNAVLDAWASECE
ncbi:MAG: S8 family serine peptidase [Phycisphaerales bacterium]|nr:S8 family serine peptidase [Phycisphaerales bacterium]